MSRLGKLARSCFIRSDFSEPSRLPPPMWLIESLTLAPPAAVGAAAAAAVVGMGWAAGAVVGLAGAWVAAGWAGAWVAAGAAVGLAAGAGAQAARTRPPALSVVSLRNARRLLGDGTCMMHSSLFSGNGPDHDFTAPSMMPRMKYRWMEG